MIPKPYLSENLHTEIYDLTTHGLADKEFYITECNYRSYILELACGTGRLLTEFANHGKKIQGFDYSQVMVNRARKKINNLPLEVQNNIKLYQGDITDFAVKGFASSAILAFKTFHMLLTQESQIKCFQCVADSLLPGGLFFLHLFKPDLDKLLNPATANVTLRHPISNNKVTKVIIPSETDFVNQIRYSKVIYTEFDKADVIVREHVESLNIRWVFQTEVALLGKLTGMVIKNQFSDFQYGEPESGSDQIFILEKL